MTITPFTAVQSAAVAAAVLIAGVAAFQLALAVGLPLGEATLGGRAHTDNGVLSASFRALAVVSAFILVATAWIVLARAGVAAPGPLSETLLIWASRAILGFLLLNTLGNLAAPHPVERWVMGSITLVTATLLCVVVLRAP